MKKTSWWIAVDRCSDRFRMLDETLPMSECVFPYYAFEIFEAETSDRILDLYYQWVREYYRPEPTHWLMGVEEALSLGLEMHNKMTFPGLAPGHVPTEFHGKRILLKSTPGIELGFDNEKETATHALLSRLIPKKK